MVIGNGTDKVVVDTFTQQGERWAEETKLTASYGSSNSKFWSIGDINRYTLRVGDEVKYGKSGVAYSFVVAVDRSWDEVTRQIPRNGITSGDRFGWSVSLSGNRALIGDCPSNIKGDDSGEA